jgi:hypothetical protein
LKGGFLLKNKTEAAYRQRRAVTPVIQVNTPYGLLEASECGDTQYPGITITLNGVRVAMVEYTDTYKRIQTIVHSSSAGDNDCVEDILEYGGIVPFEIA